MKAILKRRLCFTKNKDSPFLNLAIEKGTLVEVIKCYTEEFGNWSCWCIKILYNNEKYWCIYDFMTFYPEPCPIIFLEN